MLLPACLTCTAIKMTYYIIGREANTGQQIIKAPVPVKIHGSIFLICQGRMQNLEKGPMGVQFVDLQDFFN